jgi:hypothetical protein
MIMAVVGFIPKVMGMRMATAFITPKPGRTPTMVPMKTPIKQYKKLTGERATVNPNKSLSKTSKKNPFPLRPQDPFGQRGLEQGIEKNVDGDGGDNGKDDVENPSPVEVG